MRKATSFSGIYGRSRSALLRGAICFALVLTNVSFAYASPKKHPPAEPLDLNSASALELQQLPGIGPSVAKAIVDFREKSGPFRRVEELLAIRGITRERLEKIRPYVKVVPPDWKKQSELLNDRDGASAIA